MADERLHEVTMSDKEKARIELDSYIQALKAHYWEQWNRAIQLLNSGRVRR